MDSKKSHLIAYIAAGGLGLLACGAAYLFLSNKESGSGAKGTALSREVTIKVMNDLRRELFPYFKRISARVKNFKDRTGAETAPKEIKEGLFQNEKSGIEESTQEVFAKHGVKEADFEYSCQIAHKDDSEIKAKMDTMQKEMDDALEGMLKYDTKLPAFMNPKKTLEIVSKVMKASLNKMNDVFTDLSERGVDMSLENPIIKETLMELRVDLIRHDVLRAEGLDGFEDHPEKILAYAVTHFEKIDPAFRMSYDKLETQNTQAMGKIFEMALDRERAIDDIGKGVVGDTKESVSFGRSVSIMEKPSNKLAEIPPMKRGNTSTGKAAANLDELKRKLLADFKKALESNAELKGKDKEIMEAFESIKPVIDTLKRTSSSINSSSEKVIIEVKEEQTLSNEHTSEVHVEAHVTHTDKDGKEVTEDVTVHESHEVKQDETETTETNTHAEGQAANNDEDN
eukprot:CAMPEP_0176421338 /NCGR_PEP_ID=MMETSP0127-20121128/9111_1 /TAXON_ID=938130 /ORGANISM="Platyophrya macrostoma, Strain WH" /LENGTH=454 /DNA_ID=CAMNT_0017802043 /DNA_START=14 /DNA_END=1378 /DNA_ORIENTATION=-